MINYFKYLFFLVFGFLVFSFAGLSEFVSAFDTAGCIEQNFVVTAYYSPESGQIFYYKPNFEEEKILQGEGDYGASGKKVFNGMLAGPTSYAFGTVIYFPSLGVGEIADRGGAIVEAGQRGHDYDRIDIRMGEGEEGLIRALIFGKKTLSGYLCTGGTNSAVGLDFESVPTLKNFFDLSIRIQQLSLGRNDIWTWTLQKYLVKLGYLNKKYQHGNYDIHTQRAVCNYQVKKGIIVRKHPDCGKFGTATRYQMKLDVQNKNLLPANLWETTTFDEIVKQAKYLTPSPSPLHREGNAVKLFQFYRAYTKNQKSSEIEILQKFLQSEKVFSGKIDGIYSNKVISSVFDFQKKYQILSDTSDAVLKGYLGPSTRKKMNEIRNK